MQWTNRPRWPRVSYSWLALAPLLAAWTLALAYSLYAQSAPNNSDKHIMIFSPQTGFLLPLTDRDGRSYVGLIDVLEPLGRITANRDGQKWKLRFERRDAEFIPGQSQAKVDGKTMTLMAPFLLESGRGLVPVSGLGTLIQEITGTKPVVFHEESRRLFVGKVAVRFTEDLRKDPTSALVLTFTSPVSPTIASEPGQVRLRFTREPIMPPPTVSNKFDDPIIHSAQYEESDGVAVLTVAATAPLLASFSNEGRTLTLSRAPDKPAQAAPPPTAQSSPLAAGTVQVPPGTATQSAVGNAPLPPLDNGLRHFFAVIDAGHGGEERGAKLSDELAEKDVCLSFARHLLKELQSRGISALILRDADATLTLEQRASLTNSAHPAIYIALHAASQGQGVRIYTSLMPYSGNAIGPFQPWDVAQAPYVRTAAIAAASVASELRNHKIPARILSAPLRPLNNVVAPAMAIEVASPDADLPDLVAPNYQQSVASGIADGVSQVRQQLESGR